MATIQDLLAVVPPPKRNPFAYNPAQYRELEAALGLTLPRDYYEILDAYGAGTFFDFFALYGPENSPSDFIRPANDILDAYRSGKEISPQHCPFAAYPEPGGLLPCGSDENGNYLFWLTEGEPDAWPIVLSDDWLRDFEKFEGGLLDFLYGVATQDLVPALWGGMIEYLPLSQFRGLGKPQEASAE